MTFFSTDCASHIFAVSVFWLMVCHSWKRSNPEHSTHCSNEIYTYVQHTCTHKLTHMHMHMHAYILTYMHTAMRARASKFCKIFVQIVNQLFMSFSASVF